MPQLDFQHNGLVMNQNLIINNGSLSFFPFLINDSISWVNFNVAMVYGASGSKTQSLSVGLYSISGSSLSLTNSITGSFGITATGQALNRFWFSATATSATQNINPGNWYFGILFSTVGASSNISFGVGASLASAGNAFPGGFIGGAMTNSTNALPSSIATSNLNITGIDAMFIPCIIISA